MTTIYTLRLYCMYTLGIYLPFIYSMQFEVFVIYNKTSVSSTYILFNKLDLYNRSLYKSSNFVLQIYKTLHYFLPAYSFKVY